MEVLCLDLVLAGDLNAIEHPELRHVEQALQSVEFARLEWVHAKVNLGQKRKIFDIFHLVNFLNVVQIQIEEL